MADEATGQGAGVGASASAAPAATPAATVTDTPAAAGTPAAATGDQQQQPVLEGQPAEGEQQQADEFAGLFDGEEPLGEDGAQQQQQAGADLQQYLSMNPNITNPAELAGAVADAGLMWDVVKGAQPASALFDVLRQNNPQAWQNVMQGVAQYLEQVSGLKFIDPATATQQQNLTPEQQRIQALEQQMQTEARQREEQALTQRVNVAQQKTVSHITAALKGSFMEGNEAYALSMVGMKLAGREMELVDALQRGDTSMLDRALKQVRHEERIRFNAYGKRLAAERKAIGKGLPRADGSGAPPDARQGSAQPDLKTREGRLAYMASLAPGNA